EMTKDKITIRLSNEVTTYFRALGKGWQTHMNEVLREYVSKHPV
ncbi:MAG: BrnA antitoxin family protein, partial [Thiotrichales bacterium]|nr:BrnA antitoxin family protein [Thiotrichales bacterium]